MLPERNAVDLMIACFYRKRESNICLYRQLDILLGQDENLLLKPDTTVLYQAVALQPYDDYIVQAYANDPAMKLLRAQTELARNGIRSAKSFSLPRVCRFMRRTPWYAHLAYIGRYV